MKILIIGGTGLISTAITRQLLARGDAVTLYNRGQTPLRVDGPVRSMTGDRTDFAAFESQIAAAGAFDCVIDMVCYHPDEAESAVRTFAGRTGHYIFCSTVDVYTKPAAHYPIREDAERQPDPAFGYAFDKAACEAVLFAAHARGELPVTIIRPAHTYGEGGAILHSLGWATHYIDRIRRGRPILVHGDGTSLWASCHVDDVAAAFVNTAGRPTTQGKAYHVAGEAWQSWNQYHQRVAEALSAPPPTFVHIPSDLLARAVPEANWCRLNFQFDNIFDNQAARQEIGFRYTIPWVEGVRRTVAWLDDHQRVEPSSGADLEDRVIAAWQQAEETMIGRFTNV
ncbi:NAD-dependent epimerase/dehydratase family protein [Caldilinea sp.]|uniref:NAD-dependent epimerase/dehydratase family protein n=1 Tax=Caldilinea sp. TaxID=2293560 RepID=UPI002CF888B1|nr:NAD-dependent epimerase/dehydratase family protein [Anaerolineales bacterium]HQY90171.1 NAD-dependent epimerase/dehydratase family protein [Caldilinea sp.]